MELAATGLKVAVNFLNSRRAAAERVCEQIRGAGGVAEAFRADVRDEDQVLARLVGGGVLVAGGSQTPLS